MEAPAILALGSGGAAMNLFATMIVMQKRDFSSPTLEEHIEFSKLLAFLFVPDVMEEDNGDHTTEPT